MPFTTMWVREGLHCLCIPIPLLVPWRSVQYLKGGAGWKVKGRDQPHSTHWWASSSCQLRLEALGDVVRGESLMVNEFCKIVDQDILNIETKQSLWLVVPRGLCIICRG